MLLASLGNPLGFSCNLLFFSGHVDELLLESDKVCPGSIFEQNI